MHLAYLEATFLFTGWLDPSNAGLQVAALGAVLVCLSPVCSSVVAPSFGDPFYTDVGMLVRTLVLFTNFYAALFASPRQTTKASTINAIQKYNERKDAEFHCPLVVHLVVRFVLCEGTMLCWFSILISLVSRSDFRLLVLVVPIFTRLPSVGGPRSTIDQLPTVHVPT